jgi:hypothetical protein
VVLASHLQLRELEVGQSELAMNEILPIDIIDSFLEEAAAVDMIVADPAIPADSPTYIHNARFHLQARNSQSAAGRHLLRWRL